MKDCAPVGAISEFKFDFNGIKMKKQQQQQQQQKNKKKQRKKTPKCRSLFTYHM